MKALYYLLSSSQGFPISKCNSPSTKPEPNWQNIARLIAFVSNIFPKQEEIQFSDGQYTFFSKPQSLKNGSYYFVTIFTGDGPLINLSSLSSYIGFVTSVLFQVELDECFKHLGDQNNSAIQSSTYHDTIQNDSGGGDGDYENSLSCLHDIFPVLLERLSVFEEHFIRELLMSERDFYHRWFLSVSEYLHKALLCSQNCFSELYVVYQLSKDNLLSSLLTVHRNQNCHNEVFIDDLRSSLIEYAQSASMRGANLADPNPIDNIDQEQQVSHLLNVVTSHPSTTLLINDDGEVTSGSYFAVSQFVYVSTS